MYSVYGIVNRDVNGIVNRDVICIYNDLYLTGAVNALTPKLTLADNTAGTLEITLPVGNAGYDKLERLSSELIVKRNNEEIWAGRIISEKKNFQNSRILTCEGELAYLNDTTQPPKEYKEIRVYDFIEALLKEHNSKVSEDKQLEMGSITVDEIITRITDNETTMKAISDHLIDKFDGHIRIRRFYDEDGVFHRYFDYFKDYPDTNEQTIRFGQNLLDFTRNWDMSEYATVITPRGAKLDTSPIETIDAYLDVSDVNGGSRYVTNEEAIKRYGWIEAVVDWEDITEPAELLQKAEDYLKEEQFDDVVIEISAVDLGYLSKEVQSINLLDNVRCISKPHGMDKVFHATQLSIQLDNPKNSTYTLGDTIKNNTLTTSTRAANAGILERIAKLPNEKTILDKAKDNATSIMNMATQGYVTIIKNQTGSEYLAISSEKANVAYDPVHDVWKEGTRLWKWSVEGLGYSKDGGRNYDTAITMKGEIVADYITTGTMSADRIRTGLLQDEKGNTTWNLTTGVLTMKNGSISLGIDESYTNGRFSVTDKGYLTAEYGKVGGFTIDAWSIYNDIICLDSFGMSFHGKNGDDTYEQIGNYGTQYWAKKPEVNGLSVSMEYGTGYIAWAHKDKATDDDYTIKLMYTSTELPADNGGKFVADRIHLGTYMQLDYYGFSFKGSSTSTEYKSFTLTSSSNTTSITPRRINLVYNLSYSGSSLKWESVNCCICNGVIMKE